MWVKSEIFCLALQILKNQVNSVSMKQSFALYQLNAGRKINFFFSVATWLLNILKWKPIPKSWWPWHTHKTIFTPSLYEID